MYGGIAVYLSKDGPLMRRWYRHSSADLCQEERSADHTTSDVTTQTNRPEATEGPRSVAAPRHQRRTAQTCSGPRGEQSHGRLLWVSVLRATHWSVRVKGSEVGVVPLLTLGRGIGRGVEVHGASVNRAPAG